MLSSLSRFATIALLGAAALPAATITGYTLQFNGDEISQGVGNVSLNPGSDVLSVNGTLGLYDQNGTLLGNGSTFSGPFSFRFTDATIACTGSCGFGAYFFSVSIGFDGEAPVGADGSFGIEGSGTEDTFAFAQPSGNDFVSISNFSTLGNFSESIYLPSGFLSENGNGSNLNLTMFVQLGGLSDGQSLSLPNSLFQQVNLAEDGSVPEPGTLAIVGAGLVGAVWFRRRVAK